MSKFPLVFCLCLGLTWLASHRALPARSDVEPTPPLQLDDPPAILSPKQDRSEQAEDRVAAAALFAHGRILLQRGEEHGALRRFQRAGRYDQESLTLSNEIVELAARLNRPEEAARYAVLAAERRPGNPQLLIQLGRFLSGQNDLPRAVRMYVRALEVEKDKPSGPLTVSLRFEMARLYFIMAQYPQAADSFAVVRSALRRPEEFGLTVEQRQQLLGKPERLYSWMGDSFLLAGRPDEAAEMYRQAHGESSDDALLAFQLARVYAAEKKWAGARRELNGYFDAKAITAGRQPYALLEEIIQSTAADKAAARAELLDALQQLYENDSNNAPLASFLAKRLSEDEQLDASQAIYRQLLKIQPGTAVFQGLSKIYVRQGKVDELHATLARAIDGRNSLDLLGPQLNRIAGDSGLSAQLLEKSREELAKVPSPLTQDHRLATTLLAIAAGDFDAADEFCKATLKADGRPGNEVLETVGLAFYVAGQGGRAARVFREAVASQPSAEKTAAYYYYLAGAQEMAGDTDDAARTARQAAALRPASLQFQSRVPWILYHARRYEQAESEYERVLARFDANYESVPVRRQVREIRLILSNLCVLQDRSSEAEEWLEQVLDEFPEDIAALNDLGYLWVDQGRHLQRGLGMIQTAVEGDPENIAYRDSLGWAYYRLGRYDEATRELEVAAEDSVPDGVILDHLGDAYLKTDAVEKGLAAWRKAAEVFRANQDVENVERTEAKIRHHTPP